jgi:hypothetical protein
MMLAVPIAGLILGFLAWLSGWVFDFLAFLALLLGPVSPGFSQEVIIYVGPYSFSSASPAFWPILFLAFALFASVLVGFAAVVFFAVKMIRRRTMRKA